MQITIGENDGWKQTQVNGPETTFQIDFPFFDLDDVQVWRTAANGNTTLLVRGLDYDITGTIAEDDIYPAGAAVLRAPVSDGMVTLARRTEVSREANFPNAGFFDRASLNADLNRLTVILQDFRRIASGALHVSEVDAWAAPNLILPPLKDAPNTILMFDAVSRPYYGTIIASDGYPASAFGLQMLNANDASQAMDLLGFSPFFKSLVGAADQSAFLALIGAPEDQAGPVGSIYEYAGETEPSSRFMFCDGRLLNRTTFSALFTAIGDRHGVGDGANTFAIPDRRGNFAAGRDDMGGTAANRITQGGGGVVGTQLGAKGGLEKRTMTVAQMPTHTHAMSNSAPVLTSVPNTGGSWPNQGGIDAILATIANAGSGEPMPTLPPTYINNFIIRVN